MESSSTISHHPYNHSIAPPPTSYHSTSYKLLLTSFSIIIPPATATFKDSP
ncbi:MAG: hypothetical protein H8E08_00530, partial [Candidatus Marinimicrobia bacterium]|nr:hypothetical protein [Candidatus Neomarinimicrobiota bacterium]